MTEDIFKIEDEEPDYQLLPLEQKIERSKEIIRLASRMSWEYYKKPFICCYSGGKDSEVLLHLCEEALPLSEFEVLNSHTTVDAPETVRWIRQTVDRINGEGGHAQIRYPHDKNGKFMSMWTLIPKKSMPPSRTVRYCCSVLKEASTPNRMAVIGVRSAESKKRQGRDIFQIKGRTYREAKSFSLSHTSEVFRESLEANDDVWDCTLIKSMKKHNDTIVNPIYDWTDADIWDYIRREDIKVNPLYGQGYKRIGCIGCPLTMIRDRKRDFERYPAYKKNYIKAFQKMINARGERGMKVEWKTGEEVFDWWMDRYKHEVKGQMTLWES